MEPEGLIFSSQTPASVSYSEPGLSNPQPRTMQI
jgi:hypothetical protein